MAADLPRSLLDRLIDDEPDVAIEPLRTSDAMFEQFKLGLRRDLEGLLNGRKPFSHWLAEGAGLAGTVVDFGMPDLSTEDFSTAAGRDRIRGLIAACIRAHEKRLSRVEVEAEGGPTASGVRFRINAVIHFAGYEEDVIYDARLRPTDRVIDVALAGR